MEWIGVSARGMLNWQLNWQSDRSGILVRVSDAVGRPAPGRPHRSPAAAVAVNFTRWSAKHMELHGPYSFDLPDVVREGVLRPLPQS